MRLHWIRLNNGKAIFSGVFDFLTAATFPVIVPGAIVTMLAGVKEVFDLEFVTVGYPQGNPLGVRQLIGKAHVQPPPIGTVGTAFIQGVLVFPVTAPSTAEVRIYGNGQLLGMRPVTIVSPPPQQPPSPQGPGAPS
jgi:hypothetical protein